MWLNIFSRSFSSEPCVTVAMLRFQNSELATPIASMTPRVTARRTILGAAADQSPVCQDTLITCSAFCRNTAPTELITAHTTIPATTAGRRTG